MKSTMKIDFETKSIIMNAAFAKAAANVGTKEFRQLQEIHKDYPDFRITTRTIKRNPSKESYRGLTYEYMERYIRKNNMELMAEYKELRLISECHSVRYPTIKKWFLAAFPEVAQFGIAETEEIENELSISEVKTLPNAA
ncbi:MAG: hypothetical protein J6D00_08605 [Christensenellaceae bacterium]|nr:hypothetical protein [Christensenellaceae bacterium]